MTKDVPLKLLLIGDAGTGKTNILSRLIKDEFNTTYKPTNGVTCDKYNIIMETQTIQTNIWDIGGQKEYHSMVNFLIKDTDGILLVYDISSAASFENVTYWLNVVTQFGNPKTVVKLIGNKNDLDRSIPIKSVKEFATDKGVSFIETSASGPSSNVKEAFQWIIKQICIGTENSDDLPFSTCGFISNCIINNHQVETQLQNPFCNDAQQQPFQVVLVDLKLAAKREIHCVEKSLDDPNLKYVALSYRWGELQETVIDTKLGYTAVITSFDIRDFYSLCQTILLETDLNKMDYVWVDAICVDQTNYDKKKSTIYQMSNIYEKAKYILAVPDLHMKHLKNTLTSNKETLEDSSTYQLYLYHLIHRHFDDLALLDDQYLDTCGVPKDPELRQLLNNSTDHFRNGFLDCRGHRPTYNEEKILDHLGIHFATKQEEQEIYGIRQRTLMLRTGDVKGLHDCQQVQCRLDPCNPILYGPPRTTPSNNNQKWQQLLQKRSTGIRRSMGLMTDLIKDWASRVWVISEYNIAKKKNNLKFWFIQLGPFHQDIYFFDFMDSSFYQDIQIDLDKFYDSTSSNDQRDYSVYHKFHQTIATQLNQQSFFEMMLKSKASKNEDRFYAIFPLTDYKSVILDKSEVSKWKIGTLISVRIKMFQVLNIKDKLNLLYFSCGNDATFVGEILPTFATSSISWDARTDYFSFHGVNPDESLFNFELDSSDAMKCYSSDLPNLNLKPKEYYIVKKTQEVRTNPAIWSKLTFEDAYEAKDIVSIPTWTTSTADVQKCNRTLRIGWPIHSLYLQGNFKNNIWIIIPRGNFTHCRSIKHDIDDYNTGFNIY